MGWLFTQMWVLCLAAFLLGAGVTWLLFVRPRRGAATSVAPGPVPTPPPDWVSAPPRVAPPAQRTSPPPESSDPALADRALADPVPSDPALTDSALAALDERRSTEAIGRTAAGALDQLSTATAPMPLVPSQARSPEDPRAR